MSASRSLLLLLVTACGVGFASPCEARANPWVGEYVYEEALTSAVIQYHLTIFEANHRHIYANLDVDGYQSMDRFGCSTKIHGHTLQVLMTAAREGNTGVPPRLNTVLLELVRTPRGFLTHWKFVQPQLGRRAATTRGFVRTSP